MSEKEDKGVMGGGEGLGVLGNGRKFFFLLMFSVFPKGPVLNKFRQVLSLPPNTDPVPPNTSRYCPIYRSSTNQFPASFSVNSSTIAVSGFSSGGCFATQFHTAFSATVIADNMILKKGLFSTFIFDKRIP